uniref:Uncharacterized protein n=1 Tax=Oryza brachyantha TaxID=4533 RepID=J3KZ38_ORYBR
MASRGTLMEVTGKMLARVKRIWFANSQIECEVMLPQSVPNGGASSSMVEDQATQRKPKRKQRATLVDEGILGDDPPESKVPNLTRCSATLALKGWCNGLGTTRNHRGNRSPLRGCLEDEWESMGNDDVDFVVSDTDDEDAHADRWEVNLSS